MRTREKSVEDFFIAAWASRVPLYMNNGPDIAIKTVHAIFHILSGSGTARIIGNKPKTRFVGFVQITIKTKSGTGDKEGTTHAYDAGKILEYQDISGVKMKSLDVQKLGVLPDEEEFYTTIVRVPFHWDD